MNYSSETFKPNNSCYIKSVNVESKCDVDEINFHGIKLNNVSQKTSSTSAKIEIEFPSYITRQDVTTYFANILNIVENQCIGHELLDYMEEETIIRIITDAHIEDRQFFVYINSVKPIQLVPILDFVKKHKTDIYEKYKLLLENK